MTMLQAGATIGILGGGQLGRMLAMAAAKLGYRVVVLAPEADIPAAQVANHVIRAAYDDGAALAALAEAADVITYEFENIPDTVAQKLALSRPVRPGPQALATTQDRLAEKRFLASQGIPVAPYRAVDGLADLKAAVDEIGLPGVLKTRRFGYDGKGQIMLRDEADIAEAWAQLQGHGLILEGFVTFEREASVLVARGLDGQMAVWPMVHNVHRAHILHESRVPAGLDPTVEAQARAHAARAATALDYVGVLAVEFFIAKDGHVIANEMAPRVHNSGHWTLEGAVTSQFENHIRAICGLPLGAADAIGPVLMRNLVGPEDYDQAQGYLRDPAAHLHLYGKGQARPGRKMGHVTWVGDEQNPPH